MPYDLGKPLSRKEEYLILEGCFIGELVHPTLFYAVWNRLEFYGRVRSESGLARTTRWSNTASYSERRACGVPDVSWNILRGTFAGEGRQGQVSPRRRNNCENTRIR